MGFYIIVLLCGLVGLAGMVLMLWGWIKILIEAFREGVLWGLACIFVPFAILVFAILNWSEVKQDFFKYVGGFAMIMFTGVAAAIVIPMTLAQTRGMNQEAYVSPEYSEGSGDDIFAQPTMTATPFQPTPVILNRSPIPTRTPLLPTSTPSPTATPIQADRAENHIGETLEFYMDDGQVFRAVLLGVEPDALRVQRRMGGGNMEYKIQKSRLKGFNVTQ
jgi:hypothetical protein